MGGFISYWLALWLNCFSDFVFWCLFRFCLFVLGFGCLLFVAIDLIWLGWFSAFLMEYLVSVNLLILCLDVDLFGLIAVLIKCFSWALVFGIVFVDYFWLVVWCVFAYYDCYWGWWLIAVMVFDGVSLVMVVDFLIWWFALIWPFAWFGFCCFV